MEYSTTEFGFVCRVTICNTFFDLMQPATKANLLTVKMKTFLSFFHKIFIHIVYLQNKYQTDNFNKVTAPSR